MKKGLEDLVTENEQWRYACQKISSDCNDRLMRHAVSAAWMVLLAFFIGVATGAMTIGVLLKIRAKDRADNNATHATQQTYPSGNLNGTNLPLVKSALPLEGGQCVVRGVRAVLPLPLGELRRGHMGNGIHVRGIEAFDGLLALPYTGMIVEN
jgi:hypothetical protein